MHIAIIGTGNVGGALATNWSKKATQSEQSLNKLFRKHSIQYPIIWSCNYDN